MSMTLPQSLALVKFLDGHLKKAREQDLVPQAAADMTPGERLAVKFGGRLAAWVSMPHPAVTATVKDKDAFLAWVRQHLPGEVEMVEQVRPATQKRLLDEARAGGWLNPETGAREPVPGVETGTGTLTPRVELGDDAAAVIAAAWAAGEVDLSGVLALPAAGESAQ